MRIAFQKQYWKSFNIGENFYLSCIVLVNRFDFISIKIKTVTDTFLQGRSKLPEVLYGYGFFFYLNFYNHIVKKKGVFIFKSKNLKLLEKGSGWGRLLLLQLNN